MKTGWLPYFFKEMEKKALFNLALNAGFGAMTVHDKIKENNQNVRLESTKQQENALQLPNTSGMDFEGGKRIDPISNSAVNKF